MLPMQDGASSNPGQGTKIPHAAQPKKKKKFKKQPLFLDLCCYLWTYRVSILIEMSRVPVSIYTFVPQLVVPRTQVKDAVF